LKQKRRQNLAAFHFLGVVNKVYFGDRPYTLISLAVPTYTLPLATVGTLNFIPAPAWSPEFVELFHNSVLRLVAS
jgi:hypothetical protein